MYLQDVPYPLRICVEMLHYCCMSNKKTQEMLDYYTPEEGFNDHAVYSRWKQEHHRLTEKQMVDETMTLASELRIREIVRDELGTLKRNVDNPL